MGTLYLVATPIGNLEDISPRALRLLAQARLIAAEDTRQSHKLLSHYQIKTPVISYYEHNKLSRLDQIIAALVDGDVVLISDAGTPALNDPGYELVRAALQAGFPVSPIPGPSAPLAALVASGLPTQSFLYLGYPPRKAGERQRMLAENAAFPHTLIFLEAPHRLLESLQDMLDVLGDRPVAVAREITKLHEEFFRGPLSAALVHFQEQPPRGEFTLVVAGQTANAEIWDEERLMIALEQARELPEPAAQLAARLSALSGWPRREIYQRLTRQQSWKSKSLPEGTDEPG